jgi:MYXO-CTERM domain-containing protein
MRFRIAGSALAVAILSIVGCGSSGAAPTEKVGQSENAIQGGMTDTTHTFAVAMCIGAAGGPMNGQNCQALCSGALIAPNLVISARHCVDTVSSDTVDCSSDTFGSQLFPTSEFYITSDYEIFDPAAKWYQAAQIITPTPTSFCGNDLSLIILSSNVPSSEVPTLVVPEIWYPVDSPMYSGTETAIGFGLDAPDDEYSAGTRRYLEDIPIECVPNDPEASLACAPVAESGIATNEFEAGNGPCEGDSGSSAYEQTAFNAGTFLSLGVLSRGGVSGDMCVGSVYTQLNAWQSLIVSTAETAASMGGYPVPTWATKPSGSSDGGASHDAAAGDGGGTGGLPVGATCSAPDACQSGECVAPNADAGYVCSQKCSGEDAGTCPMGFECFMEYCFAGSTSGTLSSVSSGGGCSVANAAESETSEGWVLAASVGLVAARRRRRRR